MELGDFQMGINQLARLSDWLKTKGLTAEDFDECVHYIAQMEQKPTKKKSGSPPLPTNEEPEP